MQSSEHLIDYDVSKKINSLFLLGMQTSASEVSHYPGVTEYFFQFKKMFFALYL